MIKRTLYFGNPAYLSKTNKQLLVRLPEVEKNNSLPESFKKEAVATIPIEDIGMVIIDHQQVIISQGLMASLMENNAAVVVCSETHHPSGLFMPLDVNTLQHERFKAQITSSLPLKKQLWQQTITAKIENQAAVLGSLKRENNKLLVFARNVKSGDPENVEGRASYYYWSTLFPPSMNFTRKRDGAPPNNMLNYGYAILRAIVARSLVASGLLPTLGIHHSNKYNAFCLADDMMEPYRPVVDRLVYDIAEKGNLPESLTPDIKKQLLALPTADVVIDGERSPLMVATQRTAASLAQCFDGKLKKITYPQLSN